VPRISGFRGTSASRGIREKRPEEEEERGRESFNIFH